MIFADAFEEISFELSTVPIRYLLHDLVFRFLESHAQDLDVVYLPAGCLLTAYKVQPSHVPRIFCGPHTTSPVNSVPRGVPFLISSLLAFLVLCILLLAVEPRGCSLTKVIRLSRVGEREVTIKALLMRRLNYV
jgi:hypothetical protein